MQITNGWIAAPRLVSGLQEGSSWEQVPPAQPLTGQEYWQTRSAIAENHVYDQTNIRLREFSVGYNFPDVSSLGIESASIQVIGRNLFFFERAADDIDPEQMLGTNLSGQGIASGSLPSTRSLGLNLTLKF